MSTFRIVLVLLLGNSSLHKRTTLVLYTGCVCEMNVGEIKDVIKRKNDMLNYFIFAFIFAYVTFHRISYSHSYFIFAYVVWILTYIISKVWNPLFPLLRRNTKIDNKLPINPKIPTTSIATPSNQNFAFSLSVSSIGS